MNKKYVGFVFQQYHLLDGLTVAGNLVIPLSYRNIKKSARGAIVADTLDRFRIVGKKDLYPSQLSGAPPCGRCVGRHCQSQADSG